MTEQHYTPEDEARDDAAFYAIMAHAEQRAADTYRRMHASADTGTRQELDREMFEAFKRAGGEASF